MNAAICRRLLLSALLLATSIPVAAQVRIIQTNSQGDNIHLIDPATNQIVGEVKGVPINHGAAGAPDGSRLYFSSEAEQSLHVVDGKTLQLDEEDSAQRPPEQHLDQPRRPQVYVGIVSSPGAVDVIDTATLEKVKSIPTKGGIHNVYVTPDGKYVVAGSIAGKLMTVIDQKTDEPAWTLFQEGVRPMAFETNADGSTKRIFVAALRLPWLRGRGLCAAERGRPRIELPNDVPPEKVDKGPFNASPSHGLGVAPDGKTLWVTSRPNARVYAYSLPDLKLLPGYVDLGGRPDWVTFTPDSKLLYIATENTDTVVAIDVAAQKRNHAHQGGQVAEAQHHVGGAWHELGLRASGYGLRAGFFERYSAFGATALTTSILLAPSGTRAAGPEEDLPDGEGKKILLASCTSCHDLSEVTKFRGYYDRKQWRDIVVTMMEYGAPVDEKQVDILADYLAEHLGKQ